MICTEPLYIGLLGTVSFVGFTLGSFLFLSKMDSHGRKPIAVETTLITPIGLGIIVALSYFFKSQKGLEGQGDELITATGGLPSPNSMLHLLILYVLIFCIGLTFSTRQSAAFVYACELLPTQSQMLLSVSLFAFDGMVSIFATLFFRFVSNHIDHFFMVVIVIMIAALMYVWKVVPESPKYLLQREMYEELGACLFQIGTGNGIPS